AARGLRRRGELPVALKDAGAILEGAHQAAQLHAEVAGVRVRRAAEHVAVPEGVREEVEREDRAACLQRVVGAGREQETRVDLQLIVDGAPGAESVLGLEAGAVLEAGVTRRRLEEVGEVAVEEVFEVLQDRSADQQSEAADEEV